MDNLDLKRARLSGLAAAVNRAWGATLDAELVLAGEVKEPVFGSGFAAARGQVERLLGADFADAMQHLEEAETSLQSALNAVHRVAPERLKDL